MQNDESRGVLSTADGPLHWLILSPYTVDGSPDDAAVVWLTADELIHWRGLRTAKRRGDWLLGRRAAKRLIAGVMEQETGRQLSPTLITILPHADGWPIVTLPDGYPLLTLSISHSQERSFCAVMIGSDQRLGADVEAIVPRSQAFIEDYYTPLERDFLVAAPPDQRDALVNAIWSGKEAALKAIRRGLAEDTRIVSCMPHPSLDEADTWWPLRIIWNEERANQQLPQLTGRWQRHGDFVLTLASPG